MRWRYFLLGLGFLVLLGAAPNDTYILDQRSLEVLNSTGAGGITGCSGAGAALQYNKQTDLFGCLTGLASGITSVGNCTTGACDSIDFTVPVPLGTLKADAFLGAGDVAEAGVLRMANSEQICWEASPADGDGCIDQISNILRLGVGAGEVSSMTQFSVRGSRLDVYYNEPTIWLSDSDFPSGDATVKIFAKEDLANQAFWQITNTSGADTRTGFLTLNTVSNNSTIYLGGGVVEGQVPTTAAVQVTETGQMSRLGTGSIESNRIQSGATAPSSLTSPVDGDVYAWTASTLGSCATTGSATTLCRYKVGTGWQSLGDGGSGGAGVAQVGTTCAPGPGGSCFSGAFGSNETTMASTTDFILGLDNDDIADAPANDVSSFKVLSGTGSVVLLADENGFVEPGTALRSSVGPTNAADSGRVRLANAESICWEGATGDTSSTNDTCVSSSAGNITWTAAASVGLPTGTGPTTTAAGRIAFDTDALGTSTRGAIQVNDGTANTFVVGTTNTPNNVAGLVPTSTNTNTVTWQTAPGTGDITQVGPNQPGPATFIDGAAATTDGQMFVWEGFALNSSQLSIVAPEPDSGATEFVEFPDLTGDADLSAELMSTAFYTLASPPQTPEVGDVAILESTVAGNCIAANSTGLYSLCRRTAGGWVPLGDGGGSGGLTAPLSQSSNAINNTGTTTILGTSVAGPMNIVGKDSDANADTVFTTTGVGSVTIGTAGAGNTNRVNLASTNGVTLPTFTSLPSSPLDGDIVVLGNNSTAGLCNPGGSGGGPYETICRYDGSATAWKPLGDGSIPRCIYLPASEVTCLPTDGTSPDGCVGETVNNTAASTTPWSYQVVNFAPGKDTVGSWTFPIPRGWGAAATLSVEIDWTADATPCAGGVTQDVCWSWLSGGFLDDEQFKSPVLVEANRGAVQDLCTAPGEFMRTSITQWTHNFQGDGRGIFVLTREGVTPQPAACSFGPDGYAGDAKLLAVRICRVDF